MGTSFSKLFIYRKEFIQTTLLFNAFVETMRLIGFIPVPSEDCALITLEVNQTSDKWVSVNVNPADSIGFADLNKVAHKLSLALKKNIIFTTCFDSDDLQLNLVNEESLIETSIYFDGNTKLCGENIDFFCFKPFVQDIFEFKSYCINNNACIIDDIWFDIQQYFDFPDEIENNSTVLFFQKENILKSNYNKQSVRKLLSNSFKKYGFQVKKQIYLKQIHSVFWLGAKIVVRNQPIYKNEKNDFEFSDYPLFDICFSISTYEKLLQGNGFLLTVNEVTGTPERYTIVNLINTSEQIAKLLFDGFLQYVYAPVFINDTPSLYDILCSWDIKFYKKIQYNSFNKALAAFYEQRYDAALFCLRWIFNQNTADKIEELTDEKARSLTPDQIDALRKSPRAEVLKECFDLYDLIINHHQSGNG